MLKIVSYPLLQLLHHIIYLLFLQIIKKRQGNCPPPYILSNRKIPFLISKHLPIKWLQMYWCKIRLAFYTTFSQKSNNPISIYSPLQQDTITGAIKLKGVVITTSPSPIPKLLIIKCNALVPLFTASVNITD